jgi:signal transduction histidine kinase
MAATIAHEINNPLQAVGNLLCLLRPTIGDPKGIEYLDSVESELSRVSHIARQTLGYYRDNSSPTNTLLTELVGQAIKIYEPRCQALGIKIVKSLDSQRALQLRRGEMMQVISNLISNSIYAMQTGGILSVSVRDAETAPDGIVLAIQDNGMGIAADDIPKVFNAFFTTRNTVGTGIGLFIAKQFVEGHGGRIEIESNNGVEDHGTIVRVILPSSST